MTTKILVVDDEVSIQLLMKQRFRHRIQAGEYAFLFATSGQEALTVIHQEPDIDVLLLDINMPDMSGLAVLAQLHDLVPVTQAVMVSAYGDMDNVRAAMNRGAFDFVMKPINFKDLELTIEKTVRHVSQLRESIRAKAVADLKARFFDNITHEFRTPLSLIISPVEAMLQESQYQGTIRRNLLTVRRNAHQLLHLINQLLDLARLESDSLPIVESRGDVVAFLAQVVDSFQHFVEQKGLMLTFLANVLEHESLFDTDKWQKILTNLLSNAVKFTPEGGQIKVNSQIGPSELTLTVTDTGIGIADEHLPHIFDRFYQADTSLTRAYEGSGIGLALAYELARRLGGQLTVVSVLGVGTTFTAKIPIRSVSDNVAPTTSTHIPLEPTPFDVVFAPAGTAQLPFADSGQPVILLVEDNTELLTFMKESLADQYHILTATNGRSGLEIARQELPDIVVSDVMMPEMDGYQLTDFLKQDPGTDHIAIILLTARTAVESRREGLEKGADDYLTKPFDLQELRLRLRNLITRQQKLRGYYQKQFGDTLATSSPADETHTPTAQDVFLAKLNGIVENHLDDSTFRAELLAEAVAMSLRTLTRKLTTLAGVSPARFIRLYRLQRATELLRAGHPVSETAYMVGFEHPANFSTAFKEVFRQTPSEFIGL
ncbi:response regulator [Spirosoma sp. BT702]|uniref:histidine kinase n=1 Tax=Spirosoma profusum TaxID=2771354 RepID=A0A927AU03_9BACT|nr:response regulator [Spirosoma profusum]MBD2701757.1 response regulator [Spirosoma profusum]